MNPKSNIQQYNCDQLNEKVDLLRTLLESNNVKERYGAEGTVDVGDVTCKNADDIIINGMLTVCKKSP